MSMTALQRLQAKRSRPSAPTTKIGEGLQGVVTESCVGKNVGLDTLLNKTKTINSKVDAVAAKVKEREDAGLYTAPEGLQSLEGVDAEEIMGKLRDLDHALIEKNNDIGLFSIKIRKSLEQHPELTHLLSDEQLGIVCSGVLRVANVATEPKTKAAKSAKITREIKDLGAMLSADDI